MLAHLCQVLSHPVRLQLLKILARQDACICNDVIALGSFSQKTILEHLKVLQQAGFIQGTVDGPRRCYQLNTETLQLFKRLVETL